jgi:hypothetical protein
MKIHIVILFFSLQNIYSQENFLLYNKKINQAEIFYLDNKIDSCLLVYNKVFKEYKKCNPNDAYVAGQIAVKYKNYQSAKFFFEKGFEWGLNLKVFERDIFYNDFKKDINYVELLKYYPEIRKKYEAKIDSNYRQIIIELRKLDLKSNKTHNLFNILFFERKSSKKLSNNSKIILDILRTIINERGLPSIDRIGVYDCDIFSDCSILSGKGNTLLISTLYVHHDNAFKDNEDILYQMLLNGDITSFYYACIKDISYRWEYFNKKRKERKKIKKIDYYYHVRWIGQAEYDAMSDDYRIMINSRRAEIGLMPLEYELKKKRKANDPNFEIHFNYYAL